MTRFQLPRARFILVRPILGLLVCFSLFAWIFNAKLQPPYDLYNAIAAAESTESKILISNERPKKYVKFKQLQGAGFNNQAQEILLYHHLALLTSRTYVYQPLIWRPRGEKAKVPLSAFMRGLTIGTISETVFDQVCPENEVRHLSLRTVHIFQWEHAIEALKGDDRCIVVDDKVFTWDFLESPGLHLAWPTFQKYLASHFEWSDYVLSLIARAQAKLILRSNPSAKDAEPYMAIHLRRGDFVGHCQSLAEDHSGFITWATLPSIQSSILPPSLHTSNSTSVLEHCYPSLRRILAAISHQARERPHLRRLHIMHDGAWDHPAVYLQQYQLAEVLTDATWAQEQGWKGGPMRKVTQSSDVPVSWRESDWKVCVDVELGRRAEVFIGNGYSSMSSQIVALRLGADGGKVEDITLL